MFQTIMREEQGARKAYLKNVMYQATPSAVLVTSVFKKGALELLPIAPLGNFAYTTNGKPPLGTVAVHGSHSVELRDGKAAHFYISKPPVPSCVDVQKWRADVMFSPWWFVVDVKTMDEANMEIIDKKCDSLHVPMMVNTKPLDAWTQLKIFVPIKKVSKLEGGQPIIVPKSKAPVPSKSAGGRAADIGGSKKQRKG